MAALLTQSSCARIPGVRGEDRNMGLIPNRRGRGHTRIRVLVPTGRSMTIRYGAPHDDIEGQPREGAVDDPTFARARIGEAYRKACLSLSPGCLGRALRAGLRSWHSSSSSVRLGWLDAIITGTLDRRRAPAAFYFGRSFGP
jgi:hypothetical protein